MNLNSQHRAILKALRENPGGLSMRYLEQELRIPAATGRISELRDMGYAIKPRAHPDGKLWRDEGGFTIQQLLGGPGERPERAEQPQTPEPPAPSAPPELPRKEPIAWTLDRVKREHPITGPSFGKKKPVLYRSKLIEYETRYGKPFAGIEAYEIVEDVSDKA